MRVRSHDLVWLGEKVNPLPRQGRWDEMAEQIPDDLIDQFATVENYEALPAAIEKRYGRLADSVLLQISADDDNDRLAACVAANQKLPSPNSATAVPATN